MGAWINIPVLPGRALQRRGKDGGDLICHAAGGAWPRAMSGEGWAAGKNLISKCGRRQPKLVQAANGELPRKQAADSKKLV